MITCACIMAFQHYSNAVCRGKWKSSASHKIFYFWFLLTSIQYLQLVKTKNPVVYIPVLY